MKNSTSRSYFSVRLLLVAVFTGLASMLPSSNTNAQITQYVRKTILQGFWWDYWNNNYRFGWANYLTELAPRLKSLGFDAVWIPPAAKNNSAGSVGYAPFDMYDLGDKYQKQNGDTTRLGTKDELLRLVAVLHANGIEVVEDLVVNHNSDAAGNGGQDPEPNYSMITSSGYKNFRYVSYKTPALDESRNDYWSRAGRWAKNYQNFHPNPANNCTSTEICASYWGPDIDYETPGAFGQSSNIPTSGNVTIGSVTRPYFNPAQSSSYMANGVREYTKWFKKQTGVDGFRFDAVKHFDITTQRNLILDAKYNSGFANGGQDMLSFGEWVSSASDLDNYVTSVAGGGEEHTGCFDFSLRGYAADGGIYSMVLSNGAFDMQKLPGCQQFKRYYDYGNKRVYRTVPFVNSHDTYRPKLDNNGNFLSYLGDNAGWDVGNELGGNGKHIDPREPRLAAAYATVFAVDGNPTVYIEDIFDLGTTGKRWTHLPTSETDLPVRGDIKNIMLASSKLAFKDGNYGVPTAQTGGSAPFYLAGTSGDHIVFERTNKAIIGVTDAFSTVANNTADQQVWVSVNNWPAGTVLYDYSGAHGISTTTIQSDKRVLIKTAPNGHTIPGAYGHGYSIWAPAPSGVTFSTVNDLYNYIATYVPSRSTQTTQEWEMADDLGDSHCKSLGQGGAIPNNITNERVAGRVFAAAGTSVSCKLTPEVDGRNLTLSLYATDGSVLATVSGVATAAAPLTLNYTPTADGWINAKVRNTSEGYAGQKAWVNITYTAPAVVNTKSAVSTLPTNVSIWTGNKGTTDVADCGNWEGGLVPGPTSHVIVYGHAKPFPILTYDLTVNKVTLKPGGAFTVNPGIKMTVLSQ